MLLQTFDAEASPRVVTLLGIEEACPAHPLPSATAGVHGRWHDGRYFDPGQLIEQQRQWFRWRVRQDAIAAGRPEIPDGPDVEPPMPAELPDPGLVQAEYDQVYTWSLGDNRLQQDTFGIAEATAAIDREQIDWWYEGVGDARTLHVDFRGAASVPQRSQIQSAADIQFGAGRLVIEG